MLVVVIYLHLWMSSWRSSCHQYRLHHFMLQQNPGWFDSLVLAFPRCPGKWPYLTLPSRVDILPPSTEASNEHNTYPRINHKVTKSPSAVLTWVTPIMEPSPSLTENIHLGSPTITHCQYLDDCVVEWHAHIHEAMEPGFHSCWRPYESLVASRRASGQNCSCAPEIPHYTGDGHDVKGRIQHIRTCKF